jgi:hypothetical protein
MFNVAYNYRAPTSLLFRLVTFWCKTFQHFYNANTLKLNVGRKIYI